MLNIFSYHTYINTGKIVLWFDNSISNNSDPVRKGGTRRGQKTFFQSRSTERCIIIEIENYERKQRKIGLIGGLEISWNCIKTSKNSGNGVSLEEISRILGIKKDLEFQKLQYYLTGIMGITFILSKILGIIFQLHDAQVRSSIKRLYSRKRLYMQMRMQESPYLKRNHVILCAMFFWPPIFVCTAEFSCATRLCVKEIRVHP